MSVGNDRKKRQWGITGKEISSRGSDKVETPAFQNLDKQIKKSEVPRGTSVIFSAGKERLKNQFARSLFEAERLSHL
jgi:hypothetical protein